jgi:hypothetical protein
VEQAEAFNQALHDFLQVHWNTGRRLSVLEFIQHDGINPIIGALLQLFYKTHFSIVPARQFSNWDEVPNLISGAKAKHLRNNRLFWGGEVSRGRLAGADPADSLKVGQIAV